MFNYEINKLLIQIKNNNHDLTDKQSDFLINKKFIKLNRHDLSTNFDTYELTDDGEEFFEKNKKIYGRLEYWAKDFPWIA